MPEPPPKQEVDLHIRVTREASEYARAYAKRHRISLAMAIDLIIRDHKEDRE